MYCDIIDNKIVNPSNITGSREFDIDYTYYISCAEGYLVYDSEQDKIIVNTEFKENQKKKKILQEVARYEKKLEELDKKRVRAICEPSIKDEETQETWLDYYNTQVKELRAELSILKETIE